MSNKVSQSPENQYKVVDLSVDSTEVYGGAAQLIGVHVHTGITAQACPILDGGAGGTSVFNIPASASGGTWFEGGNMRFGTSVFVDPDNSATGIITVVYTPDNEGNAASGHGT
jgi:hypothetical protein